MALWMSQLTKWVQTSCAMEVMCPKPGNVRPGASFADATVQDFMKSAAIVAPIIARAAVQPVGLTILQSVEATRATVGHNTNLGIILLLAPLAAVPPEISLIDGVETVLEHLSVQDSIQVYEAIRLAEPAGLGTAEKQDLGSIPSVGLRECMNLAAGHDLIAMQYSNGFRQVLCEGMDWLQDAGQQLESQPDRILMVALKLLATYGDSLIARKCGSEMSEHVRGMAEKIILSGWPESSDSHLQLQQFDEFLRADGHQRNPGTTADMIAAVLFAAQREGWLAPEGDWWKSKDIH